MEPSECAKRVYIAGPIKGMENGNRESFLTYARELARLGYTPVNPWDIKPSHDGPCIGLEVEHGDGTHRYGCYLRADIEVLMHCDAFTLMPGWTNSVGATTEMKVALAIGIPRIVLRMESE